MSEKKVCKALNDVVPFELLDSSGKKAKVFRHGVEKSFLLVRRRCLLVGRPPCHSAHPPLSSCSARGSEWLDWRRASRERALQHARRRGAAEGGADPAPTATPSASPRPPLFTAAQLQHVISDPPLSKDQQVDMPYSVSQEAEARTVLHRHFARPVPASLVAPQTRWFFASARERVRSPPDDGGSHSSSFR